MKILILGGTGYLGSNIVQRLLEDNQELFCILRPTSDKSKLLELTHSSNLKYLSNDLFQIKCLLEQEHIDWLINTSCLYKINETLYGDLLDSNITFPLQVINLAAKCGVKNYLSTGTSLPVMCNDYSFFKSKYDEICEYIAKSNNLNYINLSLEMFYGGINEPKSRFLKMCLNKLVDNLPIELTSGKQKRDIVRVEDVVNCISFLITNHNFSGYTKLPFGSGEQLSVKAIVENMKTIIGSKSVLNFGVIKSRNIEPDTLADISWCKEYGLNPCYSIVNGLSNYCRNELIKLRGGVINILNYLQIIFKCIYYICIFNLNINSYAAPRSL